MTDTGEYAASLDPAPGMDAVMAIWRQMQRPLPPTNMRFTISNIRDDGTGNGLADPSPQQPATGSLPEIVVPFAFTVSGQKGDDGLIIESVGIAWDVLLRAIERDPDFLYTFDSRKLEELVAARYDRAGWKVTLTPRSADGGRDVIAVHHGFRMRIFDEVKCYAPGTHIDAGIVRALYGVIALDANVSKGVITTTADFAPGIEKEFSSVMPWRLNLRDGSGLAKWMAQAAPDLGL